MTQALNLSTFANFADSSGKVNNSGLTGVLPISNGGTNNGSLAVTSGGVIVSDGTKLVNAGVGTSGQYLISNGSSLPTWGNPLSTSLIPLTNTTFTSTSSATISGLNLTGYQQIYLGTEFIPNSNSTYSFGSAVSTVLVAGSSFTGGIFVDLNTGIQLNVIGRAIVGNQVFVTIRLNGKTGYSKSTTSLTLSVSTGTFTGQLQLWGIR